jgi:hypothetical protein
MSELSPETAPQSAPQPDIEFDKLPLEQQFSILIARQNAARSTFEQIAQGMGVVEDIGYEAAREQKALADQAIEAFREKHGLFAPPKSRP